VSVHAADNAFPDEAFNDLIGSAAGATAPKRPAVLVHQDASSHPTRRRDAPAVTERVPFRVTVRERSIRS